MPARVPKKPMKRRKAKAERKENIIRIRVTDEQREAMEGAARAAGLDLSAWLRNLGYTTATASGDT